MKKIVLLLLILSGYAAQADQCSWNNSSDVEYAIKLIKANKEVMYFCENCDEKKPSTVFTVTKVENKRATMQGKEYPYRQVVLTGHSENKNEVINDQIDLAYLYVRTGSDIFANVAQLVGCPSEGATTFIQTTNRRKKILHYYDAEGVRQNTKEIVAQNDMPNKQRSPASNPKK